jgi:hypothetical protein
MRGPMLALLTALFFLRVLGQALSIFLQVDWLPATEHWASGLIPYPILLTIQIVMLIVMVKISTDVWRAVGFFSQRRSSYARFLIALSALYAGAMALRYVLTMFFRPDMRWSGDAIPIFFHLVLAGFIYALGTFHSRHGRFARPEHAC